MDLKELYRHSKAVVEANNLGVHSMWVDEVLLDQYLFHSLITRYQLDISIKKTDSESYQLSFQLNNMRYFAIATQEEYVKLFEKRAQKKIAQ